MKYLKATKIPVLLMVLFIGYSCPAIYASSKGLIDETTHNSSLSQVDMVSRSTRAETASEQMLPEMVAASNRLPSRQEIIQSRRNKIKRKRIEEDRALKEIKALEEKREKAEAAREEFEKFVITNTLFYFKKKEYYGKQPMIEFSVLNGTEKTISRAFFEGAITNPGKKSPVYTNTFKYRFPGSLRPGNETTVSISPNMYSSWGKVNASEDATFTVTVERLEGPRGTLLFSADAFSEQDQKRLEELKEEYESE